MTPGRVLVVDDVEAHRYVMASWLRREGFEVLEAATGAEAMARIDPDLDVVVLDVHLPDMSGLDVCAAIKSDPATAAVPVMHVSGTYIDADARARGLDGGAEAYLIEPLDFEEFLATVRALARTGESRRRSDRSVEQLTRLATATTRINAAGSLVDLLAALVTGGAEILERPVLAEAGFGDGRIVRALCTSPGAQAVVENSTGGLTPVPATTFTVSRTPPRAWERLLAAGELAAHRWCVAPVVEQRGPGPVVGVGLGSGEPPLSEFELGLVRQFTVSVGVALDNLRAYTTEHLIALTLQRALLPRALPVVHGLDLEARYFAAEEGVSVGGDFYDAFELDDGRTAVVVGDVQGHSLHAATVMAELRFSLRAFLGETNSAARTLNLLDDLMRRNHPRETATMALLVFDPDRRAVEIANAGHIPPLLLDARQAGFLRQATPLLGVVPKNHTSHRVALTEECLLGLVTDGLVERRGENLADSLEAMRAALLAAGTLDPVTLADVLVERFAAAPALDDIALLLTRVQPGQAEPGSPAPEDN